MIYEILLPLDLSENIYLLLNVFKENREEYKDFFKSLEDTEIGNHPVFAPLIREALHMKKYRDPRLLVFYTIIGESLIEGSLYSDVVFVSKFDDKKTNQIIIGFNREVNKEEVSLLVARSFLRIVELFPETVVSVRVRNFLSSKYFRNFSQK